MRNRVRWLLIATLGLFMPALARAQFPEVPPVAFTGFLSHPRYDSGGFFVGVDFLFLAGPSGQTPDSILTVGWRTEDGHVFEFNWWQQLFTPSNPLGIALEGTKLEIYDFTFRGMTWHTDCFRSFVTLGPRVLLYSQDLNDPSGLGLTTYKVDNNMFGLFIGSINEWYLGSNPLGAFSFELMGEAGAYVDDVRQSAGAGQFGSTTASSINLAGSLQGKAGFIWYAWEGISVHAGVDALWILNAQAGHEPQFSPFGVTATLRSVWPWYAGFYLGVGLVF